MDIQDTKEHRQEFESWCRQWNIAHVFPLDRDGQYNEYQIHLMYCAWLQGQAAKAQAVLEGFVLVEIAELMQIIGSAAIIEPITRGNPLMSKYKTELDFILSTVRAMIEAQEQKG